MAAHSDPTLGYATDVGRGSTVNQDKLGFYRPDDPRLADVAGSVYVVADGMGSRDRGAALADRAIRALVRAYYGAVRDHGRSRGLAMAILAADRAVRDELDRQPDTQDAGVALAAAVVRGDELIVGSVGECRVYLVRDGHPYVVSDTSDGPNHLGHGTPPQPAVAEGIPLGYGDRVLLCTDGLHQLVDDAQVGRAVTESSAQDAADRLISLANAKGGWDNITAVVVVPQASQVAPAPAPERSSEVSWRVVAVGSSLLIAGAMLWMFKPWHGVGDRLRSAFESDSDGAAVAAMVVPTRTSVPVAVSMATDTPTAVPTPTVPSEVPMPDLVGSAPGDAEQFARANGLLMTADDVYSTRVARGFIVSQEPAPGVTVAPGDSIRVTVSLGGAPAPTAAPPTLTVAATATEIPTEVFTPTPPPAPTRDDDDDDDPPPPPPTEEPTKAPPPTDKPPPPEGTSAAVQGGGAAPAQGGGSRVRGLAFGLRPLQTMTATATSTVTLTSTATAPPTASATATTMISATGTITVTPTITPTNTFTPTPTSTPTNTPTPTSTPTPTPTPTYTPAPAYLPHVQRDSWLLCQPSWTNGMDAEPNDVRRDPSLMVSLCEGTPYTGRLFRPDGADREDFFVVVPRTDADFELLLEVPDDRSVDYDLYVYERFGNELGPRGINGPGLDERVLVAGLPAKAYYVRVVSEPYGQPVELPYTLSWRYR